MFSQNSKLLLNPSTFKYQKGFTLIELLVVIAIIGILASVVLASLNTARTKGTIASIKSNLKNMIPQAELAYDVPGNYSTVCTDPKITDMITSITNAGGTARCYTYDNTRWAVAVKLNSDSTKNFAVDSMGVVTFNTGEVSGGYMTWDAANTACSALGGRIPSLEELKALYSVYTATPTGFLGAKYWSNTIDPLNINNPYAVGMSSGTVYNSYAKTETLNVRAYCVF